MIQPRKIQNLSKEVLEQRELEKISPSTGFKELDECIGGFLPKHLYTLSGPTNGGKTSLACNFADALRKQGRRVLYIALEPDINVVSILASVRLNKRFSELTEDELTYDEGLIDVLLQEDVKGVSQLVPIIKNTGHNYSLIVIDHIGYFVSSENNTAQNQANILKLLAMLAKQLQTAVL